MIKIKVEMLLHLIQIILSLRKNTHAQLIHVELVNKHKIIICLMNLILKDLKYHLHKS